ARRGSRGRSSRRGGARRLPGSRPGAGSARAPWSEGLRPGDEDRVPLVAGADDPEVVRVLEVDARAPEEPARDREAERLARVAVELDGSGRAPERRDLAVRERRAEVDVEEEEDLEAVL